MVDLFYKGWVNKARNTAKETSSLENRHVKNVVIGAGMAGLLTAYLLQEQGMEVVVLEAGQVACGQTGRTTAKITAQHGLYYGDMIKKVGVERARGYAMANTEAIRAYEDLITREHIECDFVRLPSYLYSLEESGRKKLQREAKAAGQLGMEARYVGGEWIDELPFSVEGAVCFEKQAQFHPMKFVDAIRQKLEIWEYTRVLDVEEHLVITNAGTLTAENIIFACHYPFLITPGCYFLRQHQERSYVLALEGWSDISHKLSAMYYGIDKGGLSLRSEGDVLLLGGGGHRTGKKFCYNPTKAGAMPDGSAEEKEKSNGKAVLYGYDYLRASARRLYPSATTVAAWSAQDCMTHDRIPFIGRYSILRPYWYVTTGFQKWGMTSAMVAATIISEKIGGRESTYEWVFSPQRFLPRAGFGKFCVDAGKSLVGLTAGWFGNRKNRCTHMGCSLRRNPEEGTKDCPCHGSRFCEDGGLLDGPANGEETNTYGTDSPWNAL